MSPMCLLKEENEAVRVRGDVCVNLLVLTHHKKALSCSHGNQMSRLSVGLETSNGMN